LVPGPWVKLPCGLTGSEVDQCDMTNCIGIHSARLLARTGIDRTHARDILAVELHLTTTQAEAVTNEAWQLEAHAAEVGREPSGRRHYANLHVDRDHAVGTHNNRVQVHFRDFRELVGQLADSE